MSTCQKPTSETAKLKFDIIKHIIDVKLAERAAIERAERAAKHFLSKRSERIANEL